MDWEAEGLLDGVEGEARQARRALLETLHADGVEVEELVSRSAPHCHDGRVSAFTKSSSWRVVQHSWASQNRS